MVGRLWMDWLSSRVWRSQSLCWSQDVTGHKTDLWFPVTGIASPGRTIADTWTTFSNQIYYQSSWLILCWILRVCRFGWWNNRHLHCITASLNRIIFVQWSVELSFIGVLFFSLYTAMENMAGILVYVHLLNLFPTICCEPVITRNSVKIWVHVTVNIIRNNVKTRVHVTVNLSFPVTVWYSVWIHVTRKHTMMLIMWCNKLSFASKDYICWFFLLPPLYFLLRFLPFSLSLLNKEFSLSLWHSLTLCFYVCLIASLSKASIKWI